MSARNRDHRRPHRRFALLAGCLAVALAVVIGLQLTSADSRLSVRVVNDRLVDGNGQTLRLLGVNRSGAEYACLQGAGVVDGPTDRQAVAAMAAWRLNAVRLPLNEDCWLGINGVPPRFSGARYRAGIAAYVRTLHQAGLYVILDLHWNAPGTRRAVGQLRMPDLDHAPAFWSSVAREFKQDPAVVFDLYNEPFEVSWHCWRDGCTVPDGWRAAGMQTLVNAVRSSGAQQPIVATGLGWGSDLSSWAQYRPDDPAHQLVAGFHAYDFRFCTPDCWVKDVGPVLGKAPVVTTELGQRACGAPFMEHFMRWADRAGVSYLGWVWNPWGCGAPALISSWDGTPTPSGQRLRTHLEAAAQAARHTD